MARKPRNHPLSHSEMLSLSAACGIGHALKKEPVNFGRHSLLILRLIAEGQRASIR